ncbi:adenosine kinase [Paracoccaceae bacterium GXU_MW_L88]
MTLRMIGIGNAIIDVMAHCEDSFLDRLGIQKGIMQLVGTARAKQIYDAMGPAQEISGGSVANTMAALGNLGLKVGYIGKIRDDQLGEIYAHDIRTQHVTPLMSIGPADAPLATGRSIILITPDGERSMNTYLGIAETLGEDDLDLGALADTDWLFLEGYLYDRPASMSAFDLAARKVREAGGKVAMTLSDPFCVERHRAAFLDFIRDHAALVLCNQHEACALFETDDLDTALEKFTEICPLTVCTQSEKGATVVSRETGRIEVATREVKLVDATGAGDLFAAGFLYGILEGQTLENCARMGNIAAAEIISHIGARPETPLQQLFGRAGL